MMRVAWSALHILSTPIEDGGSSLWMYDRAGTAIAFGTTVMMAPLSRSREAGQVSRSLILSPQMYGSPWFLRDDEYPKLARIFNLHRRYRDILVSGIVLSERRYGPHAVSRGDGATRLVTLRNLGWEPVTYALEIGEGLGLESAGPFEVRTYHPIERIVGRFELGDVVDIEVLPYRAALILVTSEPL